MAGSNNQDRYYVVGKRIGTTEQGHIYPKDRQSIAPSEIQEAVPTGEVLLFRTKKEAERYAEAMGYDGGGSDHSYIAPVFEVQLRNSIDMSLMKKKEIGNNIRKWNADCMEVNANNLFFLSGQLSGQGFDQEYNFKSTDIKNRTVKEVVLDNMGFNEHIKDLREKELLLLKQDHKEAAKELHDILDNIDAHQQAYLSGQTTVNQLVEACKNEVTEEKTKKLAEHRGIFKEVKSFIENIIQIVKPDFKINSGSINKINKFKDSLDDRQAVEQDSDSPKPGF